MKTANLRLNSFGIALAAFLHLGSTHATPLLCEDSRVNHMYVDTSVASACLSGGVGNLNGNARTDDFLTGEGASLGLVGIGSAAFTQSGSTGTFSLAPGLWSDWSEIAIGFKFGTGNKPDNWFVYLLNPMISSGDWQFVNVFSRGGGLSHIQLYGANTPSTVPEPGTLALFGIGLVTAGFLRRRRAG